MTLSHFEALKNVLQIEKPKNLLSRYELYFKQGPLFLFRLKFKSELEANKFVFSVKKSKRRVHLVYSRLFFVNAKKEVILIVTQNMDLNKKHNNILLKLLESSLFKLPISTDLSNIKKKP